MAHRFLGYDIVVLYNNRKLDSPRSAVMGCVVGGMLQWISGARVTTTNFERNFDAFRHGLPILASGAMRSVQDAEDMR